MKVLTVLGTRPEIIRLSRIIPLLDGLCDHVLVHTGQNFDPSLSKQFFDQLGLRPPDHHLGVRATGFAAQVGQILTAFEPVLLDERPDRLLILGDTNSGLTALVGKRRGVPVYHMEAGNRCFDDRVPEELNRRVIDHSSDVLMPYTRRSRDNLIAEGIDGRRIHVIGNPIWEVIRGHDGAVDASDALRRLDLVAKAYFLVTLHRAENVDLDARLATLVGALERVQTEHGLPVIVSTHPRTRSRLDALGLRPGGDVRFVEPFGFADFIALERDARCVLTDSGTVQEECCILRIPNVTLRDVTERPETVDCGSNILSGADPEEVSRCVRVALGRRNDWSPPEEYLAPAVSSTVANIVLGHHHRSAGSGDGPTDR
jgi:UDP-N-acetylglucosamine 2-epimerase (non-hydrolysing)